MVHFWIPPAPLRDVCGHSGLLIFMYSYYRQSLRPSTLLPRPLSLPTHIQGQTINASTLHSSPASPTVAMPFFPSLWPRQVSFTQSPVYSRLPYDNEIYVMKAFAKRASHWNACADPYKVHPRGGFAYREHSLTAAAELCRLRYLQVVPAH